MPKRKLDYMINSPYKKRKLSGEFIYKPKGFFGESVYIKNMGLKDKCVNPKCISSGYFGLCLEK
tara:strand:- start:112 stop:303 length:192 start_codon:yes stop_codon:yes gene_type:complete